MKTRKVDVILNDILIKKDFEIPEFWADRAATIVGAKYATDKENSAIAIIDRVVKQITEWGFNQDYFNSINVGGESDVFRDDLKDILTNQRAAFNSPVWFNCGVPENNNQMSACFIFPVEDNMEDILAHTTREGLVFRSGSGAGVNVSKLRAKGEKLSNKGEASGPISFMRTWDANAGSIKSGGKTRRSAKMVCMDIDHPDIHRFIQCKKIEENKAKILMAAGVDPAEAYATVAFQNTNHSIRVTDEFMSAGMANMNIGIGRKNSNVLASNQHQLINRGDGKVAETVDAAELLMEAAQVAWETGDPGIQYHDAMNRDNPVPTMGNIRSTNPCFAGETRISTPYGLIPIKELCEKAVSSGKMTHVYTKNIKRSRPVAYMATGINDILKVTLSDGREIKCTPNHNWYINGSKIEAQYLEKGMPVELFTGAKINNFAEDSILYNGRRSLDVQSDINKYAIRGSGKIKGAMFPTEITPEFSEILGHLTGDGWISEGTNYSVGWIFGTHKDENVDLYNRYKEVLDSYFKIGTATNTNGCKLLRYTRSPILNYFLDLGFARCKAPDKRVPEFVFRSDNEIISNYLKGYFGADGTVYGKEEEHSCSVNCASTSKKLLQDVQLLLDVFGIRSRIKRMKKAGTVTFKNQKTYKTHATFRLSIDTRDILKFKNEIGFSVEYKNIRLKRLLEIRKERVKVQKDVPTIVSVEELTEQEPTYNLTEPINNLVYAQGVLIAQCSEFSAIDNSSCNLSSLNLLKYWGGEAGGFDWILFEADIRVLITAMDILVEAADYPTPEIREITVATRPLGLGFSNLGAYLMIRGIPYDSNKGREIAAEVTKFMTTVAYKQSIKLALKLGPFKAYYEIENERKCLEIAQYLTDTDETGLIYQHMKEHGLRNSQLTLLAPTGTISFMMDCDSTGIEPLFALQSVKTLAGGGTMEIIPTCVQTALSQLETVTVGSLGGPAAQNELSIRNLKPVDQAIFDTSNKIAWKGHVDMMAACQKHLNGAISKTVNMPKDCTPEEIMEVYQYGWKQGLKAIAVYRDGSKGMQPLTEIKETEEVEETEVEERWVPVRRKLPDTCYGPRHKFNIGGFKGYIRVSTYADGNPGEIFLNASKNGTTTQGLLDSFATSISLALQYGVPLEKLVEKFSGTTFMPAGFTTNEEVRTCTSVIDYVFKWMKHEFLDEDDDTEIEETESTTPVFETVTLDGNICLNCGGLTQQSGNCHTCLTCGENTGCG